MGLQRYTPWDNMGVPVMCEDGTGGWVLLEDVIKLLENEYWHDMAMVSSKLNSGVFEPTHRSGCIGCQAIALIKGKNK